MKALIEKYKDNQELKKAKTLDDWKITREKGQWKIISRVAFMSWLSVFGLMTFFWILTSFQFSYFLLIFVFIVSPLTSIWSGWAHWRSMEKMYQQSLAEKAEELRKLRWEIEFMEKK